MVFCGMLALMRSALIREIDVATEFLPWLASSAFGAGRHLDEPSRRAYRAGIGRQGLRLLTTIYVTLGTVTRRMSGWSLR